MRILHTADWHFGKTLEGKDRQAEQEQFVDELCMIVERERIDIVLVAGDVYQSVNPTAAAEELFYETLDRLADHGRRAIVVIAGNHDSPERLCAATPLAERHGITLVGLPKDRLTASGDSAFDRVNRIAAGPSWVELAVPGVDHTAVVASLPFPSEARLAELLTEVPDEAILRTAYSARIQTIFRQLEQHYRHDTVNIAMTHVFVQGGEQSDSERQIQLGGAYAVDPTHLPASAQYVALGHLHRPQKVAGSLVPTRYAGSPLAYSFSETGHRKSVVIVDVAPGQPPKTQECELSAGRPLVRWTATGGISDVYRWVEQGKDPNAWIDLEIHLTEPLQLSEAQMLRTLHSGFVNIRPVIRALSEIDRSTDRAQLSTEQLFIQFYQRQMNGAVPSTALVELFMEMITPNVNSDDDGLGDSDVRDPSDEVAG